MRLLLVFALVFVAIAVQAQIFIPLKVVDGVVTFEGSVKTSGMTKDAWHARTLQWMKERFLTDDIMTLDKPEHIVAQYTQDYSNGAWSGQFQHELDIRFQDGVVSFTITDRQIKLLDPEGNFKKNLNPIKVLFEESVNEHFWSYQERMQKSTEDQ